MARVNLDRMMRILLPYLMRQRMQEQYLEGSSAQYEELAKLKDELYSKSQKEIQNRASENAIKLELVKTGRVGVEDLDRPLDELLHRLGQAGVTHPAIPTISPEILEERKRPFADIMTSMSEALRQAKYLPAEKIPPATGLLGSERVMDFLKQAERTRTGKEERILKGREVTVSEEEVGLKGKPKTKEQLEDQLKFLDKKEKTFEAQLKSIGTPLGLTDEDLKTSDDPKIVALREKIGAARKRKLNTISQLLGDLDKKKADKIISKLRAGGATVEALEKYKEKFKKEENLTEEEYQYIKLNLR